MADTKISALTELTTPADGDKIPIVDVSDTTQAASGTTKFIQKSNLVTGSGGSGVWSLLETVTCASQTYIEFDGDGSNYTDLTDTNFEEFRIVFDGVVPSANASTYWYIIDNGARITSGYHAHDVHRYSSSTVAQLTVGTAISQGYVHAKFHNVGAGALQGYMLIPRMTSSDYPRAYSNIWHWNSTAILSMSRGIGGLAGTSATREGISLKRGTGNWGTSGSIKLYGRAA